MIYFIQQGDDGPVKIGYCQNRGKSGIFGRLRTLQVGNPERLYLRGVIPNGGRTTEQALHRAFASDRLTGEWFRPSKALDGLITLTEAAARDADNGAAKRLMEALAEVGARTKGRPRIAQGVPDGYGTRRRGRETKAQRRKRLKQEFEQQVANGELVVRQEPA